MAPFDLPDNVEARKDTSSSRIVAASSHCGGTVVIVDDEPFILRGLARMLERTAFVAVPCDTPSRAIERVVHEDVVLVVSDITMPEMSGLELLRRLQELDATLPVVLMTGHSDPLVVIEALEAGASEYLLKPFDVSRFRRTVELFARPPRTLDVAADLRKSADG